jgi:hypothetical protein
MKYELWNCDSDELLGTIEIPNLFEQTPGAFVNVRFNEGFRHDGKIVNAAPLRVCHMKRAGEPDYYALETRLPIDFAMRLEGFVPKLLLPRPEDYRLLQ